jgi:PPOX class probable F420-dependent enzyme
MRLDPDEARRRFAEARVARMATVRSDGRPHIVPVTFVVRGDRIEMAVDAKPKLSTNLQRLRNVAANAAVAVLVDHYADDWRALWWVRADGDARLVSSFEERRALVERLLEKYPQHGPSSGVFGAAVVVDVAQWSGWAFAGAG